MNATEMRLMWPEIGETAVSEYDTESKIFACGFPWLFPSGAGDYLDFREVNLTAANWAKYLMMYEDGGFVRDKMFCFFILNYETRR